MAILTFPAIAGLRYQRLVVNDQQSVSQSPFTGKRNVGQGYTQWNLQFQPTAMKLESFEMWSAFFANLRGQKNSFYYYPVQSKVSTLTGKNLPLGSFFSSPTVTIGGWLPFQLTSLRVGQRFSVADRLYEILTAPSVSDSNGRCIVEVAPYILKNSLVGTAVEFLNPRGIFYVPDVPKSVPGFETDRIAQWPVVDALEDVNQ
jgi:hypothetical protein